MVTREEVVAAYRFILGREPENDVVLEEHMEHAKDWAELRFKMLFSPEFQRIFSSMFRSFEPTEPLAVDVDCSPAELAGMLARIQKTWTQLGEEDPMWSVLTKSTFKLDSFEINRRKFYQSGRIDVERYLTWLARHNLNHTRFQTCLEFGCGVGRVTSWLAAIHPEVIGCDVSAAHLRLVEDHISEEGLSNVRLIHLRAAEDVQDLPAFDVLFSIIVLQHNPPPLIEFVLGSLLKLLRPGGVAYFQVPTYWTGYSFNVKAYLDDQTPAKEPFEMHLLPQQHIFLLAERHGCSVLEVQPDNYTEVPGSVSNTFLMMKRP